jgi:hypothetical protein
MVEALLWPDPHNPAPIGGVLPVKPSVNHVAVGLWVATLAVLILPSPHPDRQHKVREHDLLKAYSIATTTFALL